ncbi:MAG: hypothetical protein CR972_04505 [Candidatus Moraniibacteriota bacterium]|nr:MAG: hypothetical protein CR972_04505 [Candidatus Moranbacteria bacterium]
MKKAVLIFPVVDDKILLGLKQKKVSKGLWSGYGGKVDKNETIVHAAKRELAEECGGKVTVNEKDFVPAARIDFALLQEDDENFHMRVFIYILKKIHGTLLDNAEMQRHTWFDIDNIPYDKMLPDHKIFLPKILCGKFLSGSITTKNNTVCACEIENITKEILKDIFM